MKSLFALCIVAVFLVSDLNSVQSTAIARKSNNKSQLQSFLPPMAGRSSQNLETFVVTAVRDSTNLTPAEKQSLLSDFFSLISRSSSMGGLIKDFFAIQPAPAPEPPTPRCEQSFDITAENSKDVETDKFPKLYQPSENVDCTYFFSTAFPGQIKFSFDLFNNLGSTATLKLFDGPSTTSTEKLADGDVVSTGEKATLVFTAKAGGSSKWKVTASRI